MKPFPFLAGVVVISMSAGVARAAGLMPQDNWRFYGKKLSVPDSAQKKGITIGSSGIFVGVTDSGSTTSIQKYSLEGAYLSTFSTTFTDVTGMACDSIGNLYVFDRGQAALKAFDPSGTLLWTKGSPGNGQEQFSTASASTQHAHLSIDKNDKLYVLDRGNSRVQVFDKLGNFQTAWGTPGTSSGSLQDPFGISAGNDQVVIVDSPGGNRQRLQAFSFSGTFLKTFGYPNPANTIFSNERFALSPDGLLATSASGIGVGVGGPLMDASLTKLGNMLLPAGLPTNGNDRLGAAFTPSGDLWMITAAEVWLLERRHSSTDNPLVRNALPLPEVIKVVQRPASTFLDIDFKVTDTDNATVEVAALAFVNGGDTLADVLRVATLVEGTDVNVGPGQASNVAKRLTWDAAADWSSSFGELQIEILAQDARGLLGIHWVTVPAAGGVPAFQASMISDTALLSVWYWLIAKGDSAITLVNGEVKGVGGNFDSQVLASGAATTAAGRAFVYERLGVRAITAPEITSIQAGNFGLSPTGTNTVVKP